MGLEYSGQIFEKYSILNSLEIRPVEAGFFHTDRQSDERTDRQVDRETRRYQKTFFLVMITRLKI